MCPIYNKKDRTNISNYRLITLLNSDYKLLTKVLALQPLDEIQTMFHPDQSSFVKMVKELNKHAYTRVAVNWILSSPFKVERGVRQDNPLSCALFNPPVQPLACRMRNDANMKGLDIPGIDRKPIISLYAADTCLFAKKTTWTTVCQRNP